MPGLNDFVTALGLALVLEGVLYSLAPGRARAVWAMISSMPEGTLRMIGLGSACAGVLLVWLVRG
jgi:uncharacterized protein YjeT (DUF2065 family)